MVAAVASMRHGRGGSSSTSGMAPRPWHGSTAMRAANNVGYREGRERYREQRSSAVVVTAATAQRAAAWQQRRWSAGLGPANTTARATIAGQRMAERDIAELGRGDRGQKAQQPRLNAIETI